VSYARFGRDSGVCVIGLGSGHWECIACRLLPHHDWFATFRTKSLRELSKHLRKHERVGQLIPDHTWRRIKQEIKENSYAD